MQRAFSVSQIQFDCLSYIKEFGARPADWTIGTCVDPSPFLRDRLDQDCGQVLWLIRPALTPRAALAAVDHLHRRYGVQLDRRGPADPAGRHVFIVRQVPA
jgi:hypothetical protein